LYFLHIHEYGTLKPAEVILRRERGKKENNGRDEPNWGTVCVCMEMLQQNSLYNYYELRKMFKKENGKEFLRKK
jgi:hypothetical protein